MRIVGQEVNISRGVFGVHLSEGSRGQPQREIMRVNHAESQAGIGLGAAGAVALTWRCSPESCAVGIRFMRASDTSAGERSEDERTRGVVFMWLAIWDLNMFSDS